jgi:hypothetical protein
MQDKFNQFFAKYNNQSVETEDPTALDQCMDLIFALCDFLGIPRDTIRHQFAYQVATPNPDTLQYFEWIPNSPTNIPTVGDIIVFKICAGIPVGHVSIETGKSNSLNLVSFDQNWNTINYNHGYDKYGNLIPYCRQVTHNNYYGVNGWWHPKNLTPVFTDAQKIAQIKTWISQGIPDNTFKANVTKLVNG